MILTETLFSKYNFDYCVRSTVEVFTSNSMSCGLSLTQRNVLSAHIPYPILIKDIHKDCYTYIVLIGLKNWKLFWRLPSSHQDCLIAGSYTRGIPTKPRSYVESVITISVVYDLLVSRLFR